MKDVIAPIDRDEPARPGMSEARYRAVSEFGSDFMYSMCMKPDGTTALDWITGAFPRITGYTHDELYARGGWIVLVHPDDLRIVLQRTRELMRGTEVESVYRIVTKGGETRWIRDFSRPEWGADHAHIVRITGVMQDITPFKQRELAIHAEAQSFQALFALYPQPMWI